MERSRRRCCRQRSLNEWSNHNDPGEKLLIVKADDFSELQVTLKP
jgi:hypothetical protein